jgi:hypothetical protein
MFFGNVQHFTPTLSISHSQIAQKKHLFEKQRKRDVNISFQIFMFMLIFRNFSLFQIVAHVCIKKYIEIKLSLFDLISLLFTYLFSLFICISHLQTFTNYPGFSLISKINPFSKACNKD